MKYALQLWAGILAVVGAVFAWVGIPGLIWGDTGVYVAGGVALVLFFVFWTVVYAHDMKEDDERRSR